VAVFLVSLVLILSAVPFGDLYTIIGDNIAQVAYWKTLFHRQFVGSMGASVVKPGLIAVLGISHDLSLALFGSSVLIRVVCALAAAALVSVVAGIARDSSGTLVAGCGAAVYLLVATPLPRIFTAGSSMIFFFPLLFGGVWAFARQRQLLGSIVLCLAALIRLEAFAVLLWLSISEQLLKSRWRDFLLTACITASAVLLTAGVYYAVQGSVARFGAGGPATGYLLARDSNVLRRIWSTLVFSFTAPHQIAFEQCGFPYLAFPAGYALFRERRVRSYASLLAVPLFWLVCVALGQGQNEVRYFEFVIPVLASFGAAGVVVAFRDGREMTRRRVLVLASIGLAGLVASLLLWRIPEAVSAALVVAPALLGWLTIRSQWSAKLLWLRIGYAILLGGVLVWTVVSDRFGSPRKVASYVKDAHALLRQRLLPRGAAVLTEDDIIYNVVVKDVAYFGRAAALQDFNLQPQARRTELLRKTDYVVISKGRHSWYYLRYDPQKLGEGDQFRAAVSRLMKHKEPVSIYGSRLVPVKNNRNFLVLKVEHDAQSGG
jgi:hypothetical protein